jgi:hypothetical protein
MVLTVSFVLSPVTGFVVTVADEISFASLTPASGRQDHTTSPSARWRSRQQSHPRPSHPNPTFVTIAKRPFVLGRDGERYAGDLPPKGTKIFLQKGLDRCVGDLPVKAKSMSAMGAFASSHLR